VPPASQPAPRPPGLQYPLAQVRLFLRAVLELPTSLWAAASLPRLLWEEGCLSRAEGEGPSPPTGRWWLLRVGLYEVLRPKQRADDWIWIMDHTIQLGATRVLLIVGVRQSAWEAKGRGPLAHQDLDVLALAPTQKSNAEVVAAELEKAAQVTGVPRVILSDQCRELNCAVEQFQAQHPQTLGLNDIKHRLALLLERRLKPDPCWAEFLTACSQMRKKSQQTPLAFLAPPATKEKARFMNLQPLLRWAAATRQFLDHPVLPHGIAVDQERLESIFGGLRAFEASLGRWQGWMTLIDATLHTIRQQGYYRGCDEKLRSLLAPLVQDEAAEAFRDEVLSFLVQQTAQLRAQEHVPGTSEVIESLIGKGKRLEGQQSKGGFTRMVLGVAAAVAEPTTEYLHQALATIRTKHVIHWAQTHLGPSLQGLRQQTLGRLKAQIRDQPLALPTPTF
jgi:hypothetical protein